MADLVIRAERSPCVRAEGRMQIEDVVSPFVAKTGPADIIH
jgi:hypothetical protein